MKEGHAEFFDFFHTAGNGKRDDKRQQDKSKVLIDLCTVEILVQENFFEYGLVYYINIEYFFSDKQDRPRKNRTGDGDGEEHGEHAQLSHQVHHEFPGEKPLVHVAGLIHIEGERQPEQDDASGQENARPDAMKAGRSPCMVSSWLRTKSLVWYPRRMSQSQ